LSGFGFSRLALARSAGHGVYPEGNRPEIGLCVRWSAREVIRESC
jgi:hypothetical protein